MNKDECLAIVQKLHDNAKGKVCSRYVLALERVHESIRDESPSKALHAQNEWIRARQEAVKKAAQAKKATAKAQVKKQ